nr:hypothetical protein [Tanacetum cinerariifolium]
YHDPERDILYFEQLLNKDTSSDVSLALLPTESSSLDLPLLDSKQFSLREVERFDPFFSLTQSGGKTKVIETPSFGFHHMPTPRPAKYSPTEVQMIENEAKTMVTRGNQPDPLTQLLIRPLTGVPVVVRQWSDGASRCWHQLSTRNMRSEAMIGQSLAIYEVVGAVKRKKYPCTLGYLRAADQPFGVIICDLDKTPDLSQRPPQNCPKCGNPVDGHYCQGCALLRKKFKENMFTYCIGNRILQDSSEQSNENTNIVNALQKPFVINQDPVLIIPNPEPFNNQTVDELPQTAPSFDPTCYSENGNSFTYDSTSNLVHDSPNVFNLPPQPPLYSCEFYGNDARYGHYCTLQVPFIYPEPVPHKAYQCQPMNEDYYHEQNSCYDPNSFGFDQLQPPQYTVNHPIFNAQNDLFDSQNKLMEQLTSMCDMVGQYIQKNEEEKQIEEEQVAKARYWKIPICYDDDDDDDDDEDYTIAITHKEPDNSLSMGDDHLDIVPVTKSDEFIKSSFENLVLNPSESKGEHDCDVPACEVFTTFSNILFDSDYDLSSVDDQSFYDEDIPKEIYLNPLFDEEIISMKIDPHHFNAESDLIESLFNRDSLIIYSSSKIDSLFDEFAGELALLKSISPGIKETACDPEKEIHLIKRLLYDNSSPRPPEEFVSKNSDTAFESFFPSPIPVEDSDSLMEEIDLSFTPDDPMSSGIEEDEYDSERNILILEEILSNDSLSLSENKSFYFDIPLSSRPPAKPPDGNTRILNVKVMGDISEYKVPMPRLMITQPTLVSNQEKSPNLLSDQGHEAFQPSTECLMMIYGKNIPILDVLFFHFYPP